MRDLFSMENKAVVITGGAGYLGSAMVEGLLEFGAKVMVADIAKKKPEEIVNNGKSYTNLYSIACDISRTESIRELFKNAREICGEIDVLINCATYGAGGSIETMSDEAWLKGVDGSLGTVFRCTREVIPYMAENGGGSIVNIASMYGMVSPDPRIYGTSGQNNPPNYGAAKAGVIQLTRYCAGHLADKNIRVNSVTPGPFPSPVKLPPEEFMNNLKNKTMLGRVGKPRDIVGAVILLASDASSFMTGSNIVVDGGWTAW
ncbi:MAG TPA: SDR family oxidoreductase [Clostridiales bacterium]|nr:SDR family oxidoreductase [Clostridiales bacterium]